MKVWLLVTLTAVLHLGIVLGFSRTAWFYLPSKVAPLLVLLQASSSLSFPSRLVRRAYLGALVFSAWGDAFLALPGQDFFLPGLGSFLIAQLALSASFTGLDAQWGIGKGLPVFLFGFGFLWFAQDFLGDMLLPVSIYTTAICTMVWRALSAWEESAKFFWGALVFLVSDSLIALTSFVLPDFPQPWGTLAIMITYYLAQVLFWWGFQERQKAHL